METSMSEEEDIHVHDLIIVGAGPCGLAIAARLHEDSPSSLFTDSEHQRYHWIKTSSTAVRTSKPQKASRRAHTARDRLLQGPSPPDHGIDIAVLDAHGDEWMSVWNEMFEEFMISHLRSPMFFHPDPRDRDGLLGFVYKEGREGELREIKGVVGKALSKHQRKQKLGGRGRQETSFLDERDRPDYFRPSQSLFREYCGDIVERYDLGRLVEKSNLLSIDYKASNCSVSPGVFSLKTSTGIKRARMVVLAMGAASAPVLPPSCPFCGLGEAGSVRHAFANDTSRSKLPAHVLALIKARKPTSIVVVGGGLTSAQIVDTAIRSGVTKVYHLMQGPLKIKDFDLDISWVGKYKNYHLASFWSADDDEERFEMIHKARNGGSITPEYKKTMLQHIASKRLELKEYTVITGASWDKRDRKWTLTTEPSIAGLPAIDHVVYATGMQVDFQSIPAIQPILKNHPIRAVGGMPCLTDDLMWNAEVPLFFAGRLASLRLGPGAANLEGARQGAERIAWKVGELLEGRRGEGRLVDGVGITSRSVAEGVDRRRIGLGLVNQFEILGLASE